jgi:hypothetical protein
MAGFICDGLAALHGTFEFGNCRVFPARLLIAAVDPRRLCGLVIRRSCFRRHAWAGAQRTGAGRYKQGKHYDNNMYTHEKTLQRSR